MPFGLPLCAVRAVRDRQRDNLGTTPRQHVHTITVKSADFGGALAHQNEIRPHHCVGFCSQKVKHWIAAVLKQKCARMHQILFQFPFSGVTPPDPRQWGLCPRPPWRGRRGGEGREGVGGKEGQGKGKGGRERGRRGKGRRG